MFFRFEVEEKDPLPASADGGENGAMKLPFNRERMRERNLLDDIDEIEQATRMTLEERFLATLGMSDFGIALLAEIEMRRRATVSMSWKRSHGSGRPPSGQASHEHMTGFVTSGFARSGSPGPAPCTCR